MRVIIALLLATVFSHHIRAEEITFYQKETDSWWSVYGEAHTETGQATCYGRANKKDGSFIQIHRSLVDDELWAIIHNTAWEIETEGRGELRWNFIRSGKDAFIDGTEFTYEIKNKNTILILQIKSKRFTEVLWNTRYFTLVMPGSLQNLSVSFERKGSSILEALADASPRTRRPTRTSNPRSKRSPTRSRTRFEDPRRV